MFFRMKRWSLAVLGLPFIFLSCNLPIYEEPPAKKNLSFKGTACLTESLDVIQEYFQGRAVAPKVAASWDCSAGAIQTFMDSARGQKANSYTPGELANFIETYFLKGNKVSPELLSEAMLLKQLFIGGSTDQVTRDELERTQELLFFLKEESLKVLPYMAVYSFNWTDRGSELSDDSVFFEKANQKLHDFARALGQRVSQNSQSYSLRNFVSFLQEIESLYEGRWNFADTAKKYLPLVGKIKQALAGGDQFKVVPGEWQGTLVLGLRSYSQYLRYYYFIENSDFGGSGDLTVFIRSLDDVSSLLHDLVASKSNQKVTKKELLDILVSMHGFWPWIKISDRLLDEFMVIKQLFFSGDQESIRLSDFRNIRSKLSTLNRLAELNIPLLPYLTLQRREELFGSEEARILQDRSRLALTESAQLLASVGEGSYEIGRFVSFLKELRSVYHNSNRWDFIDELERLLPTIKKLKASFIGGSAEVIERDEWPSALSTLAVGAIEFLEFNYFIGDGADEFQKKSYFFGLSDRILVHLSEILRQKENSVLSQSQIEGLLMEVSEVIPGGQYPSGFAEQVLDLKTLILGGSKDSISADELVQLGELAHRYLALGERVEPHLDYLTAKWNPEESETPNQVRLAAEAFANEVLAEVLQDLKGESSINGILNLLSNVDTFSGGAISIDLSELRKHLDLFRVFKAELVGGSGEIISADQWAPILGWGLDGYLAYLEYNYFLKDIQGSLFSGNGFATLQSLVGRGFDLLENVISNQPNHGLSEGQAERILLALEAEDYLPQSLNAELILELSRYVSARLFSSKDQKGLFSLDQMNRVKDEYQRWALVQERLPLIFDKPRLSRSVVYSRWRDLTAAQAPASKTLSASQEMLRALSGPYPMVKSSLGEIWLLDEARQPLYQLSDLTSLNWKRSALRVLIRAYAEDPVRRGRLLGITNLEAEDLFNEVKAFAVHFGFLDPTNLHFMQSRFLEANIFTQRSNGDKIYDFEEGIEQFSLIESGLLLNAKQTPVLLRECTLDPMRSKPKHEIFVSLDCMRSVYLEDMPSLAHNMPGMVKIFRSLSPEEQLSMFKDVEVAANLSRRADGTASVSDVELLPHTIQYLESVFVRFDADHNGIFDVEEALKAFPTYRNLLKEFVPFENLKDEEDLQAIFTFMLKYGEPPSVKNLHKFLWWRYVRSTWELEADRKSLARVMAEIRRMINASRKGLKAGVQR